MEPISLSLLGGAVLTEGVRFLYDQASELIRAARERRRAAKEGAQPPATVQVPVRPNGVLDGPVASTVEGAVLDREGKALVRLAGALAPYASGDADVEPDDPELLDAAQNLRGLLEAAYGQRLTLRGERREPSGTRVDVNQVLGEVFGAAVALHADSVTGDVAIRVDQSAKTVAEGASVTGAQIGRLGGPTA